MLRMQCAPIGRIWQVLIAAALPLMSLPAAALDFPGPNPGAATADLAAGRITLANRAISATWSTAAGRLTLAEIRDRLAENSAPLRNGEVFELTLASGRSIKASDLRILGQPRLDLIPPQPNATRLGERFPARRATITLAPTDNAFRVLWQATLHDGSNYIRQVFTIQTADQPLQLKQITLIDIPAPQARVVGRVDGSPILSGNIFLAYESPLSRATVQAGQARCTLARNTTIPPNSSLTQSSVAGAVPEGQLRRAFLYYIERERAHPYRPFLHYNSWYDIAWNDRKFNEAESLAVIDLFAKELISARGVKLDSFVFDDGWDDNKTLWRFHSGFPNGFAPLQKAATACNSAVGIWLSPWGGYGPARDERLRNGRAQGFEINANGFSMSGPRYSAWFRQACLDLMRDAGINYFKFDGIGAGNNTTGPGPAYVDDIEAMLNIIDRLREAKPDLFINVTTGTWPSPFWLWHADSTWRSGGDTGMFGWGTTRQKWITYRDKEAFHNIVQGGPLYPLNSLMFHGICYAQRGSAMEMNKDLKDLADEINTYFASGTGLQELYITPQIMSPAAWNTLADAAKWSRANRNILIDSHWIGGDPAKAEVYGFASWSSRKSILMLRNPGDKPASYTLNLASALELPPGAAQHYRLDRVLSAAPASLPADLAATEPHTLELAPFEVIVIEATPLAR